MSAPRASGRWSAGEANVLSTTMRGRPPPSVARRRTVSRDRRDVDDLEQRIGRRLEPDETGAPGEGLPEHVRAGRQVDVSGVDALGPVDPFQIAEGAAVDVVAHDDLVARPGQFGDRRRRGRADREGDAVGPTLERRDRPLEALAGRVLAARVLIPAAWPADAVLGVRRGLVDRRRDRAVSSSGSLPAWTASVSIAQAGRWRNAHVRSREHLRTRPVRLEDELLAVDLVPLGPDLREAELRDRRQRGAFVGATDARNRWTPCPAAQSSIASTLRTPGPGGGTPARRDTRSRPTAASRPAARGSPRSRPSAGGRSCGSAITRARASQARLGGSASTWPMTHREQLTETFAQVRRDLCVDLGRRPWPGRRRGSPASPAS